MNIFRGHREVDPDEIVSKHGAWLALAEGEEIEFATMTIRDSLIFTDRRVFLADVQGMLGSKTDYVSIPYKSIARWSAESRGAHPLDGADLKIWVGSAERPTIDLELRKDESAQKVMEILALHAL